MSVQIGGGMSVEQVAVIDEVQEDIADDFTNIHSADHLFKGLFARIDTLAVAFVVVRSDAKYFALTTPGKKPDNDV